MIRGHSAGGGEDVAGQGRVEQWVGQAQEGVKLAEEASALIPTLVPGLAALDRAAQIWVSGLVDADLSRSHWAGWSVP